MTPSGTRPMRKRSSHRRLTRAAFRGAAILALALCSISAWAGTSGLPPEASGNCGGKETTPSSAVILPLCVAACSGMAGRGSMVPHAMARAASCLLKLRYGGAPGASKAGGDDEKKLDPS